MLENIQEHIKWLRMCIEDRGDINSVYQNISALKKDEGSLDPEKNHYSFDNMSQHNFIDTVMGKISSALKQSQKATGITLFHGDVTDKGMLSFIEALSKTNAPIKKIYIDDFPYVTDESMKRLPEIIIPKGITICEIDHCPGVSSELKKRISLSCTNNQPKTSQDLINLRKKTQYQR